ncbi:MAG: hypothetical protein Q4F29_14405, partial [Lachnospiraceae bacterium]|nr:hypothetical protein [Lachnospiraceae bacterium]
LNQKGVLASAPKLAGKDLIIEEAGDLTDEMLEELNQLLAEDSSGMLVILIDNPRQLDGIRKANPSLAGKFQVITSEEEAEAFLRRPAAVLTEKAAPTRPATIVREAPQPETTVKKPQPSEAVRAVAPVSGKAARQEAVPQKMAQKPVPQPEQPVSSEPKAEDEAVMDIDEFAQYCCHYASQIDCSITGKSMLALYERIEIMEEDGIALTKSAAEDLIEEAADRAEKPSLGKRITGLFSSKYDKEGLLILKEEHFI